MAATADNERKIVFFVQDFFSPLADRPMVTEVVLIGRRTATFILKSPCQTAIGVSVSRVLQFIIGRPVVSDGAKVSCSRENLALSQRRKF
jgi:hypothetical protein